MALFTDGAPASIDDLRRYDSSAENLAHEAGIDLDAKLSVAAEEVGQEVFRFLLLQSDSRFMAGGDIASEAARRITGLSDVVVTPSLRRWHAMRALAGLYRDAYASEVTDRFRLKWQDYERLAKDAEAYAFTAGIGLSRNPLSKAPVPDVEQFSSITNRVDSCLRIAWVNGIGEGTPSDPLKVALGPGDVVSVSDGAPNATGWNVYAAGDEDTPMLQNDTPLGLGDKWTVPATGFRTGRPPVEGRLPDYLVIERRIIRRG